MTESSAASSMIDRAKRWIKLLKPHSRSSLIGPDEKRAAEIFSNAHDFAINGGQFINELKGNYINNIILNRQAVFELLEPYACLDATKDSSARHPPPRCHPETRLKIKERLTQWLSNEHDEKMLWVRGSAGTGKSAVAQSFGDSCEEEEKFGGSYFFSRVANRNRLETVVPTLVYQLAENVPEYRSLIGHLLAETPLLLRKSAPVQFRKLIVEPFAALRHQRPRKPIVIILDGLDECQNEDAEREIIEMITNALRSNPDLPLRWLIFSRPEAHLKNEFSRNLLCGREELVIDAECWENVEQYAKDRLAEIRIVYRDILPAEWPSHSQLQQLLDAVSGLFILASTCLNFIADPQAADPPSRLNSLLTFMRHSQGVVSRSPLASLDLLYSQILEKIPPTVFHTTRRILGYMCHRNKLLRKRKIDSAQTLSNFLRLDQLAFYKAVRGLHSVASIPDPEHASNSQLQFYHASFHDFLLDPNRSSIFAIGEQDALLDIIQSGIYWCEVDATHFHTHDGWNFGSGHNHDSLPGLTWVSELTRTSISESIMKFIEYGLFNTIFDKKLDLVDNGLFSQLSDINFRYWGRWNVYRLARLCQLDPSTSIVRIEPTSATDHRMLEYFNLVIKNGAAKPAIFPLRDPLPRGQWIREYFFIGQGIKSVIVWRTKSPLSDPRTYSLRCDQKPSEIQISDYAKCLRKFEWDEERAKLEMK